jgi:hypothetical protein
MTPGFHRHISIRGGRTFESQYPPCHPDSRKFFREPKANGARWVFHLALWVTVLLALVSIH